jgi:hypothetical protein
MKARTPDSTWEELVADSDCGSPEEAEWRQQTASVNGMRIRVHRRVRMTSPFIPKALSSSNHFSGGERKNRQNRC